MDLSRMREEGVFPHVRTLQWPAYCVNVNGTKDVGACSYLASYGNPNRSSLSVQEPYTLGESSNKCERRVGVHILEVWVLGFEQY
jgi:hypothetical protein